MALRWKKNPRPSGLAGVACGPRGSKLRDGEMEFARTMASRELGRAATKGWYFFARNEDAGVPLRNTCNEPLFPDEEAAKAAAMAYVREHLAIAKKAKT